MFESLTSCVSVLMLLMRSHSLKSIYIIPKSFHVHSTLVILQTINTAYLNIKFPITFMCTLWCNKRKTTKFTNVFPKMLKEFIIAFMLMQQNYSPLSNAYLLKNCNFSCFSVAIDCLSGYKLYNFWNSRLYTTLRVGLFFRGFQSVLLCTNKEYYINLDY